TALAEKIDAVKVTADDSFAMAQNSIRAQWDMASGQASVVHDMKVRIRYEGEDYSAGMVIGAELKGGQVSTLIGFNAQQFAFYNPVKKSMDMFMYMKDGQVFIREAFLDEAWIKSLTVTDKMQSDNYVPGKRGFIINAKTGNAEFNNGIFRGTLDGVNGNFSGTVYAERIIGDVAVAASYPQVSAQNIYDGRGGWTTAISVITYTGGMPYDMTLVFPSITAVIENNFSNRPLPIEGELRFSIRVDGTAQPVTAQWEGFNVMGSAYAVIPKGLKNVKIEIEIGVRHKGQAHVVVREGAIMAFKRSSSSFY
ncbi:DUF1983 domain-containing protein, partial [Vibrio parahaemolyticus]|uniref:phage tail tip fiber protein n=1 Tax=Vibrio parahaemolyticus TaxID=670 RepID=UPI001EEBB1DB